MLRIPPVTDDKILSVDQAIKILPDRGTFIVGIRPKVKIGKMGIRIRWYAYKPEDLEQRVYNQKEQKGAYDPAGYLWFFHRREVSI